MPKQLPESKQEAIKTCLEEGVPHFAIGKEICVSIQTIKNHSITFHSINSIILPSMSRQGRCPIMTLEILEVKMLSMAKPNLLFMTSQFGVNKFV
jgi:hypothetical protein